MVRKCVCICLILSVFHHAAGKETPTLHKDQIGPRFYSWQLDTDTLEPGGMVHSGDGHPFWAGLNNNYYTHQTSSRGCVNTTEQLSSWNHMFKRIMDHILFALLSNVCIMLVLKTQALSLSVFWKYGWFRGQTEKQKSRMLNVICVYICLFQMSVCTHVHPQAHVLHVLLHNKHYVNAMLPSPFQI